MAIHELAPEVIAQIAAGEVVSRPGDVVKELVENAIDAVEARRAISARASPSSTAPEPTALTHVGTIGVEIWEGGYGRIEVADDGCGIPPDDLPAALRRHATSKIASADDLQRLASLGFRGEALAAISAVADLTLASATTDGQVGAALEARDGVAGPVRPRARRPGTTVTVERLFERVPARRKYQRASSVETAHIGALLQAFALAYPEISFTLAANGRGVLRTSGSGDLTEAAAALLGPEAARQLLTLGDERVAEDQTAFLVGVTGLIGSPSLHRATRNGIFLTVNRRPVDSRSLVYAVEEAYTTLLPIGRHPIAILELVVPPGEVDANVHPTKREVRLLRDRLAFGTVQRAVRATLVRTIGIPQVGQTRGMSAAIPESAWDGAPAPLFPGVSSSSELDLSARPHLGSLRILGQVALTYIICEGQAGLYLVDQHAAHERVLLERLERSIGRQGRSQMLLDPVIVELPRALRPAGDQYVAAVSGLGFAAEPFGDGEVVVRAVPSGISPRDVERVLREAHETLEAEGVGPDWRERLAVLLSCKSAVKAGQRLEMAEMQSLLDQLDEATLCATCSHGRPTAILLSHSQLEREFGRR